MKYKSMFKTIQNLKGHYQLAYVVIENKIVHVQLWCYIFFCKVNKRQK